MAGTQQNSVFIIAYPANLADVEAFVLGNDTSLGRPLPAGGFLVDTSLVTTRILGSTLAAVAYGLTIFLYFTCLGHLSRRPARSEDFKRKWGPYAYITGMIGLSTATFLQSTIYATTSISLVRAEQIHGFVDTLMAYGSPFPILFIIWMAEGLMFYHAVGLYRRIQAVPRYFLFIFLGALFLISLGGGVQLFITAETVAVWASRDEAASFVKLLILGGDERHIKALIASGVFVIATTFSGNLLLCVLIVARLIQHQKYFMNILGPEHVSIYGRIIVMCVESCALTVATIVVGGVLWFAAGHIYAMIALMVLPQTCCISALMLISRVAQGKATDTSLTATEIAGRVVPIDFICQTEGVGEFPGARMEEARWSGK
ncbi:hypothetical protein HYPSUDRAFT_181144 [Hypholoma sublateritium FD-334 SS-4]|uniref:Uncharacterized protein n=1 Tax=Hypholoma sublateritium (strain FD-334 SS-4) TaxID=945553 RepID=A0A0D2P602_HYPSF|nr:hypothetical protein HYPSUDRAFT_181144 [Hypholoma sublateritium FD-334 SS-4]